MTSVDADLRSGRRSESIIYIKFYDGMHMLCMCINEPELVVQ